MLQKHCQTHPELNYEQEVDDNLILRFLSKYNFEKPQDSYK